jgi:hypothetical protein
MLKKLATKEGTIADNRISSRFEKCLWPAVFPDGSFANTGVSPAALYEPVDDEGSILTPVNPVVITIPPVE